MIQDRPRLDRLEAEIGSQLTLNASLRTSIELLNNTVESQRQEIAELRAATEALLQTAQLHQSNIKLLSTEFCRDGHGV
ncbi:hypothetical protein [Leptolyngbya sp. FACHB-17]|uniref:hypothetical protein n=1 Tax=unclassified Leptolyngbya TaxID=2650499 RepID=UPI0016812D9E|nr:hypothetical protein [Leptolyngbya sp. FACHB-17]MBD2079452.1 hypothetical protein [Leptolyngbya sp. FACHB-17]